MPATARKTDQPGQQERQADGGKDRGRRLAEIAGRLRQQAIATRVK
jgi:hypothetical protein